jgi:hypothetical protein
MVADGNSMNLNIPKNRPNFLKKPQISATTGIFGDHNSERIVTGVGVKLTSCLESKRRRIPDDSIFVDSDRVPFWTLRCRGN